MRFRLTVFPDGHAILGTPKDVGQEQAQHIRRAWDEWKHTPEAMLIMAAALADTIKDTRNHASSWHSAIEWPKHEAKVEW